MALLSLLPRVPLRLTGSFHYAKDQDSAGAADKDKSDDKSKDKDADDDKPALPQTQEELEALIETAMEQRDRERLEKKKAKEKKQREREREVAQPDDEDDEDEEDAAELVRKAELKAATAQQRADEAERKALLAEVKGKLTDWLSLNARDFLGNAPDIMLHIEKALSPNAKDAEVSRVIEANAKAFIERTKSARKPASGAPVGGARRTTGSGLPTDDAEQRRTVAPKSEVSSPARWHTLNYNG